MVGASVAIVIGAPDASSADCLPGLPLPPGCTPPPPPPPPPPPGSPPADDQCLTPVAPARLDFVGLVAEDVFAGEGAYRRCALNTQAESGTGVLRQTFAWSQLEPTPGNYDFRVYDSYVGDAALHGFNLLAILFSPPKFRSGAPSRGARRGTYPPKRYEDFAVFGRVLVERYGPNGSFWREHPEIPKRPIRSWQIWNEPNVRAYWPSGPNAAQYTRLLKIVGKGIRGADPGAEIVTAALPESHIGVPLFQYLRAMYRAGAGSAFQTLGLSPYSPNVQTLMGVVGKARKLLNQHGGRRKKIWVTEIGWATEGPLSVFRVGRARQATLISRALKTLYARRKSLGIRGVVYFNWRDSTPYEGGKDFWGIHTGLLDISGKPKPGFDAFKSTTQSLR